MTEDQLKSVLHKLSCIALHDLSFGSNDPSFVEEEIDKNYFFRPILISAQIMELSYVGDGERDITFALSPGYMISNKDLVFKGHLHVLRWKFKLPLYDYGEDEESADGEEEVPGWLARGEVSIVQLDPSIYAIDEDILFKSLLRNK